MTGRKKKNVPVYTLVEEEVKDKDKIIEEWKLKSHDWEAKFKEADNRATEEKKIRVDYETKIDNMFKIMTEGTVSAKIKSLLFDSKNRTLNALKRRNTIAPPPPQLGNKDKSKSSIESGENTSESGCSNSKKGKYEVMVPEDEKKD